MEKNWGDTPSVTLIFWPSPGVESFPYQRNILERNSRKWEKCEKNDP